MFLLHRLIDGPNQSQDIFTHVGASYVFMSTKLNIYSVLQCIVWTFFQQECFGIFSYAMQETKSKDSKESIILGTH